MIRALLTGAMLVVFARAALPDAAPAVDVFQKLQQNLVQAKAHGDWGAFLENAERLRDFLNGSPTSVLEVARAELELGRRPPALADVHRFLAMGQINGILDSPLFQPLKTDLEAEITNNQSPVALARMDFALADPALVPEDIDYDPVSKQFFVTSILQSKVIALDTAGRQRDFAHSPDHWPMLALKVDPKRRRLWATEVALDGFRPVAAADWGRSAVLEYELDHGTLISRHDGPPHGNFGDMVLAQNGDPIVSDGTGGGIYRLRGAELLRIDHGDFISPQTIAICSEGRRVFVPDYVRGIAAFDLETGLTRWLAMKNRFALDGIDGLYCRGRSLVAVQNGSLPERVIVFNLDASRTAVLTQSVVERATAGLGAPTHGVFIGRSFYYIANSGWDALDEHGTVRSSAHLTPALIMRVDL
jgi:hypothetical protein